MAYKAEADNQQKTLNIENKRNGFSVPLFSNPPVERREIMADINVEKAELRKQIISAANIYKSNLAGRVYLYVCGDEYFEVAYMTDCFKHLTGVESPLRGNAFYDNAKRATLTTDQIYFSSRHPLKTAKKKVLCLHQLPQLTRDLVCVVKDMQTITITYKLGITNLEFTVGLTENINADGIKVNEWLVPRTLRINDKAIDQANDAEFVDFIFEKKATENVYNRVRYASNDVHVPEGIKHLLSEILQTHFFS